MSTMKDFWNENKWYILVVLGTLTLAILYVWFGDTSQNLLPEVYSVM